MGPLPRTRRLCIPLAAALITALATVIGAGGALAQIRINEILPDPVGSDTGTERLEIYNAGSTPIDVTGWAIDDAATIDQVTVRCRLPEDFDGAFCSTSAILQPGEFRVVKGMSTSAWLNQGGDDIYLVSNRLLNATVVQLVTYPSAAGQEGMVWSAVPNGSTNFAWRAPTLCATNGSVGDVTPPATIADLAASATAFPGEIRLTWTAPGDDGLSGTASDYDIRVAHAPITAGNFASAVTLEHWINEPVPAAAAAPETLVVFGLSPDSTWYFAIVAHDDVPNASGVSNSPGTSPLAGAQLDPDLGYSAYFGNLHSHTGYSDGVQTPADAYQFARTSAPTPLDFLAVTEHNHLGAGLDSLAKYHRGLDQAAAANQDGQFVAIYGQEWGVIGTGGHANVFESPALFGWEAGLYDVFVAEGDYTGLYTAALAHPPATYPVVVEWCHPTTSDFNGMAMTPDAKQVVKLMALVSGPAFSTSVTESDIGNTGYDDEFQEALRKGFHVSPTADQDNHNATWGASTESRTAVLATAKTKSQILGALAVGRNYATQDHNAVVQFSADGHAMGEAWSSAQGIQIAARVIDPDPGEAPATFELFRGISGMSGATLVAFNTGNSEFRWRERATFSAGTEAHYYLRIRMLDNQAIWTGPVYVTYDPTATVAVGDGTPRASGLALAAIPNPTRGAMRAEFTLPQDESRVSLALYDLSGRRVRALLDRSLPAGTHHVEWDGRGEDGRPAPAGIFFLRLETARNAVTSKVLRLR